MLLNILHTIAITCAIGTNFYIKPEKKREIKRDVNIYNYNTNNTFTSYGETDDTELLTYQTAHQTRHLDLKKTFNKQQITSNYINGEIAVYNSNVEYWQGNTKVGVALAQSYGNRDKTQYIATLFTDMSDEGAVSEVIVSKEFLVALKIQANGTLLNNKITINANVVNGTKAKFQNGQNVPPTVQYKYYARSLTTRNTMLEKYFNNEGWQNIWKDNCIAEGLIETIYGVGGYNNVITDELRQYDYIDQTDVELDYEKDQTLYPNTTTYQLIYIQQRVVFENVSQIQSNTWTTDDPLPPNYEIILTGTKAVNPTTTEIVDIPGTMIEVLGMPFTFISTAFNLTLFPGTPYELNFSTLFLSLIAVMIFVFLVRIIIRVAGSVSS